MAKTSKDARKHLREIGKLFAATSELKDEGVKTFLDGYRERKYLRQSMNRLVRRGFLMREPTRWMLTKTGERFFRKTFPEIKKEKIAPWNGKWRLVSFDIPEKHSTKRKQLRALLREFDFLPLQKSVWVSPNNIRDKFWELLVKGGLQPYCKAMVVDILEGDEDLRKHFQLFQK